MDNQQISDNVDSRAFLRGRECLNLFLPAYGEEETVVPQSCPCQYCMGGSSRHPSLGVSLSEIQSLNPEFVDLDSDDLQESTGGSLASSSSQARELPAGQPAASPSSQNEPAAPAVGRTATSTSSSDEVPTGNGKSSQKRPRKKPAGAVARKLKCDGDDDSCRNCKAHNTPCMTTDRLSGMTWGRGHVRRIEDHNSVLIRHVHDMHAVLKRFGVTPEVSEEVKAALQYKARYATQQDEQAGDQ
ncbi:hypothetical protein Trco_000021 [Trichoderma cornu-damae]|uniref:Zn(2)-C6 fungal-type domain-containing protein n=1 Tax=Trichoderma cornu-damae TaxID=654480 RepID=A0A9P8QPH7_9HYPO|nr:hypothetical protein Trco_000021 [Trichoderma cornu-damae]